MDRESHPTGGSSLRVVYISGASRCGSTVLASLLGGQPDAVSVGELIQLHRYGWLQDDYCACGSRCLKCPFWRQVLDEWRRRVPDADIAGYLRLQARFERLRSWPRLRLAAMFSTAPFADYCRQTSALLHAISAVSGKRVIVDSSKRPIRAAALSRLAGVQVSVVHLVRDVRATAWSQSKGYRKDPQNGVQVEKPPQPVSKSTRDWIVANTLAESLRSVPADRRVLVRYEDLVHRPEESLMRLQSCLALDLQDVIARVLNGEALPVGHQIAGNRVRMHGAVRLRGDSEWTHAMAVRDRDACWRLAGWHARRYGYSREQPDFESSPHDTAYPRCTTEAQPHFRPPRQVEPPEHCVPCSSG